MTDFIPARVLPDNVNFTIFLQTNHLYQNSERFSKELHCLHESCIINSFCMTARFRTHRDKTGQSYYCACMCAGHF